MNPEEPPKNLVFAIACVIKLWSHETYVLFSETVRAKIMKPEDDHTAYGGLWKSRKENPQKLTQMKWKTVVLAGRFAHKRPVR